MRVRQNKIFIWIMDKLKPWEVFFAFFIFLVFALIMEEKFGELFNFSSKLFSRIMVSVYYIATVSFFFFYYRKDFPDLAEQFRFLPLNFLNGILALFLIFLSSLVLPRFLILRNYAFEGEFNFRKTCLLNIVTFISVVLIIPIVEEIFHRGILLKLFLKHYSLPYAIIFNGVTFALAHLGTPSLFLIFNLIKVFFYGILLSSITYKSKNLSFAFAFHIANNFIAYFLW